MVIYTVNFGTTTKVCDIHVSKKHIKMIYADGGESEFQDVEDVKELIQRWREYTDVNVFKREAQEV